jgi:single-strand DNA-binding protein
MVMVEGRLQTRSWTDSNNQQRRTTEIVCEVLQLGPRAAGVGNSAPRSGGSYAPKTKPQTPKGTDDDALDTLGDLEEPLPEISSDDSEIRAEDLPF